MWNCKVTCLSTFFSNSKVNTKIEIKKNSWITFLQLEVCKIAFIKSTTTTACQALIIWVQQFYFQRKKNNLRRSVIVVTAATSVAVDDISRRLIRRKQELKHDKRNEKSNLKHFEQSFLIFKKRKDCSRQTELTLWLSLMVQEKFCFCYSSQLCSTRPSQSDCRWCQRLQSW